MKKITLILLILFMAACQFSPMVTPTQNVEVVTTMEPAILIMEETPAEIQQSEMEWPTLDLFSQNLVPSAVAVLNELQDAPFYIIHFDLDENIENVSGTVNIRYTNQSTLVMDHLIFQLFPVVYGGTMEIPIVNVNNQTANVEMVENVPAIKIVLAEPLSPGERCEIELSFKSSLPREPGGNYGLYGYFEDVVVLDGFYPQLATYDEGNWQFKFTSLNGDIKFEEMSFYQVFAEIPATMSAISSGQVVSETVDGNRKNIEFIAGPVREFYFTGSDKFVSSETSIGDTRVVSTGLVGDENIIEHALEIARASLEIYGEHYAVYPYKEFDVVSTPMLALGMEYPGVSTIATSLYDYDGDIANTSDGYYLDSVIAHEMGHQWFFNLVGNDQIAEPWLDEALTQYVVSVFFKDYFGEDLEDAYKQTWDNRWSRVDHANIPIGKPTYDYEGSEYSAIVYGRGPLFIEALEDEMGQEVFANALRGYVETYSWKLVDTDEFKVYMESACGCDLTNLFNEWVIP